MTGSKGSRWIAPAAAMAGFAAVLWLERRRPLRPKPARVWEHDGRNLTMAVASALTIRALEKPVVQPLADLVERRRWGLVKRLGLPGWAERALALVLLDYTLYLWHVLLHRLPFLWRFHLVHHADLDLTATTALRFHFGEMALSVPWRAAQVAVIGVDPRTLALWQRLTLAEVVFHHANLALPQGIERRLVRLVVTPRMHGIHHSTIPEEQNSNWSSGLTLWDRLHGTLRLDVPQEGLAIGVPAYRSGAEVTLPRLLALPFRRLPDGSIPRRRNPA